MEILRVAVLKNAVSVILVDNHPVENVTPSDADRDLIDRFIQVGCILHIPVFDHLIHHYHPILELGGRRAHGRIATEPEMGVSL
uniref:RadC-like JAB domain-containing protein n=1 Tax=Candidatus Kentrum sp. MB TaxID=2138164 RepID=A0A450XG41_9GAMM|nr:MAG: RadC-like JAB domain-containing protein [Candidatus Kentron sp. MB]